VGLPRIRRGADAVARPPIFRHLAASRTTVPLAPGCIMANVSPLLDEAPEPPDTAGPALLKLEEFLPHRLNVLSSLVSQALTRVYGRRYGIGIPEWRVLVTLGEYGVMTGKAVGAHTHMHKTKVSRAVAQLEERNLVARRANRADLREAFLSLTPAGRAIYEEAAPIALEFTQRLSEVVSSADRPAFDRAIKQLTERSATLVAEIENGKS
jgi:DNA-binding MarR family transcriptional regulator